MNEVKVIRKIQNSLFPKERITPKEQEENHAYYVCALHEIIEIIIKQYKQYKNTNNKDNEVIALQNLIATSEPALRTPEFIFREYALGLRDFMLYLKRILRVHQFRNFKTKFKTSIRKEFAKILVQMCKEAEKLKDTKYTPIRATNVSPWEKAYERMNDGKQIDLLCFMHGFKSFSVAPLKNLVHKYPCLIMPTINLQYDNLNGMEGEKRNQIQTQIAVQFKQNYVQTINQKIDEMQKIVRSQHVDRVIIVLQTKVKTSTVRIKVYVADFRNKDKDKKIKKIIYPMKTVIYDDRVNKLTTQNQLVKFFSEQRDERVAAGIEYEFESLFVSKQKGKQAKGYVYKQILQYQNPNDNPNESYMLPLSEFNDDYDELLNHFRKK